MRFRTVASASCCMQHSSPTPSELPPRCRAQEDFLCWHTKNQRCIRQLDMSERPRALNIPRILHTPTPSLFPFSHPSSANANPPAFTVRAVSCASLASASAPETVCDGLLPAPAPSPCAEYLFHTLPAFCCAATATGYTTSALRREGSKKDDPKNHTIPCARQRATAAGTHTRSCSCRTYNQRR